MTLNEIKISQDLGIIEFLTFYPRSKTFRLDYNCLVGKGEVIETYVDDGNGKLIRPFQFKKVSRMTGKMTKKFAEKLESNDINIYFDYDSYD